MNTKPIHLGLSMLAALFLTACGDSSESNPADPPPFGLHGGSVITQGSSKGYVENNNAKKQNVIRNFNDVVLPNEVIPLPSDRATFSVNQNYTVNGKSYEVFAVSDPHKYEYSRFSYLAEDSKKHRNARRIYTYMGDATETMPKMGQATYDGEAFHSFSRKNSRNQLEHNVVLASAHGEINFDEKSPILKMKISPKANTPQNYQFNEFQFVTQVTGHSFNGKNDVGALSHNNERIELETQGQFNGPNADEISGAYYIKAGSAYPYGAAGVFGLGKTAHDGDENAFK